MEVVTNTASELTITVEGALAADGRLALSEVARIAGEFQSQIERVAAVLVGTDTVRTGRHRAEIVEVTRLDLVGFRTGSAILDVRPHPSDPTLPPTLLDEAVDAFLDGVAALSEDP